MEIKVEKIRLDGGTQSRAGMNQDVINEYTESIQDGATFPDVLLYYDGNDYWLADGFHRVAAHKAAGKELISANVKQGTRRDAILYSVGANSQHGLRRSQEDKRHAIMTLLEDDEWSQWSDAEISRRVGVSKATVGKYRYQTSSVQFERIAQRGNSTYTIKNTHWGEKETAILKWQAKIKQYCLEDIDVLSMIQKGAKTLTDLAIRESDAHQALRTLSIQYHSKQFSKGMIVYHVSGRYGRVSDILPDCLDVINLKSNIQQAWQFNDTSISTEDDWIASTNQYEPGMMVKTWSGHQGIVVKAEGRWITVKSTNGTRDYKPEHLTLISISEPKPELKEPSKQVQQAQHLPMLIPAMQLAEIPEGLGIIERYEAIKDAFTSKRDGPLLLTKITDVWAAFGHNAEVFAGCGISPLKTKFLNDNGVRVFLVLDATWFDDLYSSFHIEPIAYKQIDEDSSVAIHNWRNGRSQIDIYRESARRYLYFAMSDMNRIQSLGFDVSEFMSIVEDVMIEFKKSEEPIS